MAPRRSVRLSAANLVRLVGNNGSGVPTSDGTVTTQMPPVRKREGVVAGGLQNKSGNDGLEVPSTPKKRKRTNDISPSIGTPAAAKMMALPYSSGDIDGSMPASSLKRVADPLTTNAPLISPRTSRVVANKTGAPGSPSKPSTHSQTTTGNILEKALAHLINTEPRLKPVIEKHNCTIFSPESLAEEIDPFRSLTSGIISQQVGLTASPFPYLYSMIRSSEQVICSAS
jgi:DNA-3-methyladenine glycosylase II